MKRGYSHVLQGASLTLSSTSLEDSIRHCVLRLAWRQLSKGSEAAKFFIILTVLWSPADGRKNHSLPRVSPMPQFKICLFVNVKLWACLCFGVSGLKWTLWVCPHTETLLLWVSAGETRTCCHGSHRWWHHCSGCKRSVSLRSQETFFRLLSKSWFYMMVMQLLSGKFLNAWSVEYNYQCPFRYCTRRLERSTHIRLFLPL